MKRNTARATLLLVSVTAIWAAMAAPATAQHIPGIGTVMTYNVNEGTDFLQAIGAPNEHNSFSMSARYLRRSKALILRNECRRSHDRSSPSSQSC
jgi:hypothetical protein